MTSRRPCATPGWPRDPRAGPPGALGRGGRRRAATAARAAAGPSLPRLRRARGPRALGRALLRGWPATPTRCSGGSATARTPSPAPSTGSAPCSTSWATSRASRSLPRAAGWRRSTPSWTCSPPSACGTGSGTVSRRPSWRPACPPWSSSRASPTTRRSRGSRGDRLGTPSPRRSGSGPASRNGSTATASTGRASPTWASSGPPTAGRRATRWTRCCATPSCRPVTSCAGPSR